MEWRGDRILCLFLSQFLWETANGLGVWQNRPASYWQSGGDKDAGDQALALIQQELRNTGRGPAAYALAQPPSTSSSGDSVANAPAFIRQYTISWDQDALNQSHSQGGYTAQLAGPSNVVSSRVAFLTQSSTNQNQLLTRPVSPSQGSTSQYHSSQQSQTRPSTSLSSSLSSGCDFTTTSQQASSGFQSAVGTTGSVNQPLPSQQSSMQFAFPSLGTSALQDLPSRYVPGTQAQPSSPVSSSLSSASGGATTPQQASSVQLAVGTTGSASQSAFSQQISLQSAFPSLGTSRFVPGSQAQPSSPVPSSLSSASGAATTSQQASSAFQAAVGRPGSASQSTAPQQSSLQSAFPSLGSFPLPQGVPYYSVSGTQAQPQTGFATTSQQASYGFQAAAGGQGSTIQSVAPQRGLQAPLSSLGTSALRDIPPRYVPGTLAQPSSPVSSPLSSASGAATTSQQTSSGFQSAAGTQPTSSYFISQGQRTQIPSGDSSNKPTFPSQGLAGYTSSQTPGSASLPSASQQTSLQAAFPSLGSSLSFPSVSGTQAQPPIGVGTTSQQASASFRAAGAQDTQLSSLYSSSQGQVVASSDGPVLPSQGLVSGYIAGPVQWYRVDPFGKRTLLPFQGSVSQAASSNYASTSQSQSSPGSIGFATQSQSSPASAVGVTQGGGQLPSLLTSSRFSTTSLNAANPSASVFQPFQSTQSSVSSSFGQSSFGQVSSVSTQQYSADTSQSTGFTAALPFRVSSTFPSGASTSAQGTSRNSDFGPSAWQQSAVGSSSSQQTLQNLPRFHWL